MGLLDTFFQKFINIRDANVPWIRRFPSFSYLFWIISVDCSQYTANIILFSIGIPVTYNNYVNLLNSDVDVTIHGVYYPRFCITL